MKGERVLGLAMIDLSNDGQASYSIKQGNFAADGFTFVGLISMMDPPKKGVLEAINVCKKAGLKIFMVTGDHPFTAEAIARKVNIIEKHKTVDEIAKERGISKDQVNPKEAGAAIIYGPSMPNLTENDWSDIVNNKFEIVFARISPLQKVEIVERF